MVSRIYKQILGLDVSVTNTKRMNVGKCSETLVCVEFDEQHRYRLFHFVVVLQYAVNCFWHVIHDYVQIYFVLFVSLSVKGVSQRNDIGVE